MTSIDKISLLEEILDIENGALKEDMHLQEVKEWDSIARISFISAIDERFEKFVDASELKSCKTVGDLLNLME